MIRARHFEYAMKTEGGYIRGGWSTPFCDVESPIPADMHGHVGQTRLSSSRAPSLRSREGYLTFSGKNSTRKLDFGINFFDFDIGEPHYIFRTSVR
jgi:hypothetical protein